MKWLEKETKKGILKYRMPDISEGYYFLSLASDISTADGMLVTTGKVISAMGKMVNFSSLGYSSYDELLNDKINMWEPISEISKEILSDLNEVLTKKD